VGDIENQKQEYEREKGENRLIFLFRITRVNLREKFSGIRV
jgi:hypothetical protein